MSVSTKLFEVDAGVAIGDSCILKDSSGELDIEDIDVESMPLRHFLMSLRVLNKPIKILSNYQMVLVGECVLNTDLTLNGELAVI